MRLVINGKIKPYYVQMLCMLFFPGAKFPENEEADAPCMTVTTEKHGRAYRGEATLVSDGITTRGEYLVPDVTAVSYGDDLAEKMAAGGAIIDAGRKFTSITPPWGMHTGVRPAKLLTKLMTGGMSETDAADSFAKAFLVRDDKARLASRVASAEMRLLGDDTIYNEASVYIGIPFCPSRCSYCSFVSYTSPRLLGLIPEYLKVLASDIANIFAMIRENNIRLASVYIGGGTPTVLDEAQLDALLSQIASLCDTSSLREFTLEAGRPDTITAEKMRIAKDCGITRVSVNTQTLNDEVLHAVGRRHTAADFFRAYDIVKKSGIGCVNVDLIAGLPGENADSFRRSVDGIVVLEPENISVHSFSVKKSSEFRCELDGSVYDIDAVAAEASVDYSQKRLDECGYMPYYMYRQKNTVGNLENVGYSKPSYEGLYNVYMMEEIHSIFAAGAASVTKLLCRGDGDAPTAIKRIFEKKYPYEYIAEHSADGGAARAEMLRRETARFYNKYF